ncbi:MAG: efflux RND transporter periplasmic adaptor subunit [Reyranella sp.]|uniref:divalent metal ion exporter adaptor subunit IhpB n=1 Tax=Reyranella sp. TaxID=1929291 RepID=UPI001ACD0AAC|nr:efflux RND transporter periplasmic adaptor subunit [Reyranella sp.]MBN9086405.1 efflux RND transporter periplasmic adaptor subunit [Reyranella sp.]
MMRFLGWAVAGLVCLAILGFSGRYLQGAINASKPVASKADHDPSEGEAHGHEDAAKLTDKQVAEAGIELLQAGPQELHERLRLAGLVQPNQEALVKVTSRFPGVIRSMRKRLGDRVAKDEILATVESNQSLTVFELKAPIDGTVIDRDGTLGEFASEQKPLFTVADLSTMWVDFSVHRRDSARVRAGDAVSIEVDDGGPAIEAKIGYISPLGAADTQSFTARAVVPNGGRLRPGLFMVGRVLMAAQRVEVAVHASAIQTVEGQTVVFVRNGEVFEARKVQLGDRDPDWIEIKAGLKAGETYAARNSFVVKAELGKADAGHEH